MMKRAARLLSLLTELVLLGLGVAVFLGHDLRLVFWWDVVAVIYLGANILRLVRGDRPLSNTRHHLVSGRGGFLFTVFTSLVGISSGLSIVMGTGSTADDLNAKVVGVPAVLLAWAILHFGYANRYAAAYQKSLPQRQFSFPSSEEPTFADFAYFAFTVGKTFAVSDVETRTTSARKRVLSHSVLSFIYNTVTLGIAVGVITGK